MLEGQEHEPVARHSVHAAVPATSPETPYMSSSASGPRIEDENLLNQKCGITDIVKIPREYGNEPSEEEYKSGLDRILQLIKHGRVSEIP